MWSPKFYCSPSSAHIIAFRKYNKVWNRSVSVHENQIRAFLTPPLPVHVTPGKRNSKSLLFRSFFQKFRFVHVIEQYDGTTRALVKLAANRFRRARFFQKLEPKAQCEVRPDFELVKANALLRGRVLIKHENLCTQKNKALSWYAGKYWIFCTYVIMFKLNKNHSETNSTVHVLFNSKRKERKMKCKLKIRKLWSHNEQE